MATYTQLSEVFSQNGITACRGDLIAAARHLRTGKRVSLEIRGPRAIWIQWTDECPRPDASPFIVANDRATPAEIRTGMLALAVQVLGDKPKKVEKETKKVKKEAKTKKAKTIKLGRKPQAPEIIPGPLPRHYKEQSPLWSDIEPAPAETSDLDIAAEQYLNRAASWQWATWQAFVRDTTHVIDVLERNNDRQEAHAFAREIAEELDRKKADRSMLEAIWDSFSDYDEYNHDDWMKDHEDDADRLEAQFDGFVRELKGLRTKNPKKKPQRRQRASSKACRLSR